MAAHEPFDARNVASVDGTRSFRYVRLAGPRANRGKDAVNVDEGKIWPSWQVDSKGDGAKILAHGTCTV